MAPIHILVFAALILVHGIVLRGRGRSWLMLAASVLALYWLQPATPIRNLDFWLPTASLALTAFVWASTARTPARAQPPRGDPSTGDLPRRGPRQRRPIGNGGLQAPFGGAERVPRSALRLRDVVHVAALRVSRIGEGEVVTAIVVVLLVLAVPLNRYIAFCCLTPSRPPEIVRVLIAVASVAAATALAARFGSGNQRWLAILIVGFVALFIVLKADPLAQALSAGLRTLTGQSVDQASALDIRWLGFSYLAFRLIHALRERMMGKLPDLGLREFLIYVVFFPAITAGPIDRVERFAKDLRAPFTLSSVEVTAGGWRILWGVFKKFAVADTLAIIALNGVNAAQTQSTAWTWVLLYAYAFRIYFDFSGYTDLAVGLGRWLGVKLPENFDRPYLKQNLTAFWNSWHITLAQWFRAYYFNPATRALRSRVLSPPAIIFLTQLTTMILIGLWHGITWNFVAWGAWHGLGLFIHNRWADFTKPRATMLDRRPILKRAAAWGGVLLTFHFVLLGWVWFALPEIGLSARVMLRLFGLGV